ncbi:unnamed protein product [Symbiodinium sp. CCMP2456]|nr:unnamed protein product [Symbiodinium sp. CCMP2456]
MHVRSNGWQMRAHDALLFALTGLFWELCSTAAAPSDVESKDPADWAAGVSEAVWHRGEMPKQTDFSEGFGAATSPWASHRLDPSRHRRQPPKLLQSFAIPDCSFFLTSSPNRLPVNGHDRGCM